MAKTPAVAQTSITMLCGSWISSLACGSLWRRYGVAKFAGPTPDQNVPSPADHFVLLGADEHRLAGRSRRRERGRR